jgi:outer membrane protein assembly factor BamB
LEQFASQLGETVPTSDKDWPTLRANNRRNAYSPVPIPETTNVTWTYEPTTNAATSASAAGGLIFTASHDGSVRALDASTGSRRWTLYTGGSIHYPPSVAAGKVYVGSADGWVYCLDAATGAIAWRFRAAPAERLIPVYGQFSSTWPVASGVLVESGVVYAAAGIANHDGTHVYALDAETGTVQWHNHASGALHPETSAGVSVNGHLLLAGDRLYLAGGNMVPVGSYDLKDGKCTTDPNAPQSHTQFKAGSDLFLVGDQVQAGGAPLYSSPGDYRMVNQAILETPVGDVVIAYGPHDSRVAVHAAGNGANPKSEPIWQQNPINRIAAVAVTPNAIVITGNRDPVDDNDSAKPLVMALSTRDGRTLWSHPLPALPQSWGLLVDRDGRVVVTLQNGRVIALSKS